MTALEIQLFLHLSDAMGTRQENTRRFDADGGSSFLLAKHERCVGTQPSCNSTCYARCTIFAEPKVLLQEDSVVRTPESSDDDAQLLWQKSDGVMDA
ncbi:hypothetical protein VD0002_g3148 [Verticillium dahliae]|uniref:Uncharacterized protein n=1 Tax=Verticillium dahliae TaxID=27337 RepID=A0AA45AJ78_VERDA|nr:hypothetical protein BJF96_g7352 [Verticillium dahliae]PNH41432.1 hypothetical protein VD0004_g5682 [Verticillium dahliae]PNH52511.1 hypothetical protein VD0003_g4825 [Verticillium dahliae]PNH66114.1 hypothetical protein VD0002_g3148 [Verticillium dahliae]